MPDIDRVSGVGGVGGDTERQAATSSDRQAVKPVGGADKVKVSFYAGQ